MKFPRKTPSEFLKKQKRWLGKLQEKSCCWSFQDFVLFINWAHRKVTSELWYYSI